MSYRLPHTDRPTRVFVRALTAERTKPRTPESEMMEADRLAVNPDRHIPFTFQPSRVVADAAIAYYMEDPSELLYQGQALLRRMNEAADPSEYHYWSGRLEHFHRVAEAYAKYLGFPRESDVRGDFGSGDPRRNLPTYRMTSDEEPLVSVAATAGEMAYAAGPFTVRPFTLNWTKRETARELGKLVLYLKSKGYRTERSKPGVVMNSLRFVPKAGFVGPEITIIMLPKRELIFDLLFDGRSADAFNYIEHYYGRSAAGIPGSILKGRLTLTTSEADQYRSNLRDILPLTKNKIENYEEQPDRPAILRIDRSEEKNKIVYEITVSPSGVRLSDKQVFTVNLTAAGNLMISKTSDKGKKATPAIEALILHTLNADR